MAHLLHVDTPRVALPLKALFVSIVVTTFVLGIWFLFADLTAAILMFALTAFEALLFRAVMSQRYELYSDRLRIVLGSPLAFNIPRHSIVEARAASGEKAYFYRGLRFATSSEGVVEIVRRKGLNVVISPADRDTFLHELAQAAKAAST